MMQVCLLGSIDMSWNPLSLFTTIDKTIDLASEAIEDVDLSNKLKADIAKIKEQVYITELNTKTVPWVDGLHKMQRGILSRASLAVTIYMVHNGVDDPIALGAGMAPAGLYNFVKGKG